MINLNDNSMASRTLHVILLAFMLTEMLPCLSVSLQRTSGQCSFILLINDDLEQVVCLIEFIPINKLLISLLKLTITCIDYKHPDSSGFRF